MSTSATASAAPSYPAGPSPAPRRRRWHLEDYVLVASCLGFVVWTALVGAGATGWLDHLRPSRLAPRSVPGQIYEAVSLATHPVIVFTAIGVAALVAYKRRMRRLAVALAATFITPAVGTAVSMWLSRTRPASAFADSISHQGYAYPAAHVVAVTIASWVLVTLTRAQRRPTSNIWAGSLLGVLVVLATCASQWLMGLSRVSDILGGLLLGLLLAGAHQDDLVHLLGDDDLGDGGAGDLLAVLGGDLVGGAHETVNAGGLNLGLTLGQGVGLLLHRAVNLRLVDGGGGGLGAGDLAGAGLRGGSGLGLSVRLATDQPEGAARGGTPLVIPRGDGRVGGTGDRQGEGRSSAPRLEQHGGQGGLGRPLGATTAVACGGGPLLGGQGPEAGECSTQGAGLGVTTHDRTSFV